MLDIVSTLRHLNIANVHDAYCHKGKLFIVSEYLEVSLLDLDFHLYPLAEWEMATITAEVTTPLALRAYILINLGCGGASLHMLSIVI
jgi:hypothetical protein